MTYIYGNVTYYELCYGGRLDTETGGACQDCYDSAFDIAWPHLTTTGCNDYCTGPGKVCDDQINVLSYCSWSNHWGTVRDCCPCASQEGCSQVPRCGGYLLYDETYYTPLLDLTSSYFMWLEGDLDDGRIQARITV
jgi:hypothetical protein